MAVRIARRLGLLAACVAVAGCSTSVPTPSSSALAQPPAAVASPVVSPAATPSPTPAGTGPPDAFPLAVVTGLRNPMTGITLAELAKRAANGSLVEPCDIEVIEPVLPASAGAAATTPRCTPGNEIAAEIVANPRTVALLPPGLVEPATKTLPVDGRGPFGLFGADLFGDPAARKLPYPILGRPSAGATIDPAWTAYDPGSVWTMSSVGGVCSDRGAAWQALQLHKGWAWLFDGGTATYRGKPHLDPSPPEGIDPHVVVSPVETGHHGVVARLIAGADLTIADVECPIVSDFVPNYGRSLQFSISADVLPLWRHRLGFDVVYLAANHDTDKGVAGVRSTRSLLARYGIEATGLGLNLAQAMAPAYVERGGVKIAFVAWNDVPGVFRATVTSAGVPWLTRANVFRSVALARAGGAQLVVCDPQWWGGSEYHSDLRNAQLTQLEWFDQAGCDAVIGAGTHLAGPMLLRQLHGHLGLVMASQGNLVFGQDWWQLTQEGVLMTVTFNGMRLVNVHIHPYVMVDNARSDLTDPAGAGHYVMDRLWSNSQIDTLDAR